MIKTVKVLGLSFLLLLTTSVNAESLGEISQYKELLTPKGVSGLISVTASGITNKDGILYLPSYKGGTLSRTKPLMVRL